ncbi:hypothetical protein RB200_19800 [Streptomyces sp. PmtG]
MTPAERRALLGDAVIAHIRDLVKAAPEPTPDVVDALRRIFTNPAGSADTGSPAADAA